MTDPDNTEAFLPIEEEFFRAGDELSAAALADSRPDLDTAPASDGVWSRLFKRSRRRVTERPSLPSPQRARPATEPAATAEDWDWQIAIARARHPTAV